MSIHKFVTHKVSDTPPTCEAFRFYLRLKAGEKLNREEKDRVAELLYGSCGSAGPIYRRGGWQCHFSEVLPAYIVEQYGGLRKVWAPDATSLRKALHGRIDSLYKVEGNVVQEVSP